MDRILAELLFEFGRLQHILGALLIVHLLLFMTWRHDHVRRKLIVIWFAVFLFCSTFIFLVSGLFGWIMDGVGYSYAHLYGGMWTDEEALNTMLTRWRNLLLPIYAPWLIIWLLGILAIAKFSPKWASV